ncbi:MAG TPA: cell envelope integrity protein TolA [Opitutaceae bacterium]|nr:cell envelope integrity protein TolA [Opitutaceae bacterium]
MRETNSNDEREERGFFQRFGFALGIAGIAAVVAVVFVGQSLFKRTAAPRHAPEVTMVKIISTPPPPPPPPPPPEPKMVQEKMVEQQMVEVPDEKPQETPPASNEVGTNLKGSGGSDAFGLSGNGNAGFTLGARSGGGNASASRWGGYASQVQATIGEALRRDPRTRDADFRVVVRIWPDIAGRVTRAQLADSTGDAAVDRALKDDVLTGLQLREPPPDGMPLPIVMRLTARRPN